MFGIFKHNNITEVNQNESFGTTVTTRKFKLSRFFNLATLLGLVLMLAACEDVYNPETENTGSVLVVEGSISNLDEPVTVNLSFSSGYTAKSYLPAPVEKAVVLLEDRSGVICTLNEVSAGEYKSNGAIKGQVHHQYRISITLEDGTVYQSEFDKMPPEVSFRNIVASTSTEGILEEDGYGGYNEKQLEGHQFQSSFYSPSGHAWYRLSYDIVFQISKTLYFAGSNPAIGFCVYPIKSSSLAYISLLDFGKVSGQGIFNHMLAFWPKKISEFNFSLDEDLEAAAIRYSVKHEGVVLRQRAYSLSKEANDFWKAIQLQTESGAKMFDPSESNIPGNIACVTNPENMAIGFFSASAVSESVDFFYFDIKPFMHLKPDTFYLPEKMMISDEVWEHWINPFEESKSLTY